MSTDVGWEDAKKLLYEALDLEPGERDGFLQRACSNAPELLAEVRSLLSWVDQSGEFLETPAVRVADLILASQAPDQLVGQSLGPWRIVDVIGHGGMGTVYRAERADAAFTRIVAIKVVRRGAHSADIIERFHRERETLAALDHPNIARLIDGGSTPDGQPYFVMEYVDGVRIDKYCDDLQLTIDQRLDHLSNRLRGGQYAHHALVVHRDIKPDNILVSREGVPKLLDFGIARVLSNVHVRRRARARHGGNLDAHARLRQSRANQWRRHDHGQRCVFAGRSAARVADGKASLSVARRIYAELRDQLATAKVPRPSEALDQRLPDARQRASRPPSTPHRLARRLAGDIDAIVLRALARDVQSRYVSAEQLVDELDRHLTHHPVSARGNDWSYLTRAFIRRHRVGFSIATAFALLLALGIAGVLWQASIAAEARARAERRFEDVRHLARAFIFDVDNEIVNVPGTTKARALMMRTASEYLDGLARESYGDLGLQRELASAFVKVGDAQGHPTSANVGDTAGARASYERAIDISTSILADHTRPMSKQNGRAPWLIAGCPMSWPGPAIRRPRSPTSKSRVGCLRPLPPTPRDRRRSTADGRGGAEGGRLVGQPEPA